ncbi:Asp-tRNA(Asn)/Glu-tRNA(Gln) amidotransferase subunit GatC [Terriglobus tenax]|uniref:Asp-tRNA(Asn)/Glu-tRNA(Gln) amidotransferase subunit GatC n=1 Tax=Terriglobus tenax TaxID=1111115 RepID=UPI0021DFC18B|nr:Asp-tRNA(Asn)/Glu-tRNA(Gln) amidotransferase subunit GatC [Terriglobus tenax]
MSETVTLDAVRRVAELAQLELQDDEVARMQKDLNAILGHIDQLNELDTAGVTPMAQVSEILGGQVEASAAALREDVVRPSIDRTAVLREAPEADHRFFKVPKVIER